MEPRALDSPHPAKRLDHRECTCRLPSAEAVPVHRIDDDGLPNRPDQTANGSLAWPKSSEYKSVPFPREIADLPQSPPALG